MPRLMIKEFDYYQSQWLIFAAWMPYIATRLPSMRSHVTASKYTGPIVLSFRRILEGLQSIFNY
jgi:hypothetical protein